MSFVESLWDLLFPRACFLCEREGSLLCTSCESALPFSSWWYCPVCRKRSPDFKACEDCAKRTRLSALGSALPYEDLRVRKLLHSFKYDAVEALGEPLGNILVKYLSASGIFASLAKSELILVAVPLHSRKTRWRGFNQAKLLAQEISKWFDIPLFGGVLVRKEARKAQVEIREAKERKENVKGVFMLGAGASNIKGYDVILVDDVVTSGATLEECARMLRQAGARRVFGLALARG